MKIQAIALGTLAMATAAALGQQPRPQEQVRPQTQVRPLVQVRPQVSTGLWEQTTTSTQQGATPMPDSVLSQLSAEQRARVEARMRANESNPRTVTHQGCLTDKDLDNLFVFEKPDRGCKQTSQTLTATEVDTQWECTMEGGVTATGTLHVDVVDSENAHGTLHVVANSNGHEMVRDSKVTFKWLGSDCSKIHEQ